MDSEMKSKNFVTRNLLIVSCSCISPVTNVLAKTAQLWMQKICAYVQSEFQDFCDIQEDNAAFGQHINPAFIAYIKGEIPDPYTHCHHTAATEKVESYHLKETTREKNNKTARKVKKHTSTCQQRSKVRSKPDLRMKPPPVEELVFRRKRSFISTEKVSPGSTEPPRRESPGKRNFAGDYQSHDCHENYAQDSATHDSVNRQTGAEKTTNHLGFPRILLVVAVVNALVRVVEKFCAHVQREWSEFNDIYGLHNVDVQYTEPAFIAYLKGEDTAPYISCPQKTFNV